MLGRPVTASVISPEELRGLSVAVGLPEATVEFMVALEGNIRDGVLAGTSGDLARLLGRATTPLREGLATMARAA